jgi:hypothetical protein
MIKMDWVGVEPTTSALYNLSKRDDEEREINCWSNPTLSTLFLIHASVL